MPHEPSPFDTESPSGRTVRPPRPGRPERAPSFVDERSAAALGLVVRAVAEFTGYDVAGLSFARQDDLLQMVAGVGPADFLESELGATAPLSMLQDLVARHGVARGDWIFVPGESLADSTMLQDYGWVGDGPAAEGSPHAAHPHDLLMSFFHDTDGQLVGMLAVDQPRSGRRPDEDTWRRLAQVRREVVDVVLSVVTAQETAERARLAESAAELVRAVSGRRSLEEVLEICRPRLTAGFRADRVWVTLREAPLFPRRGNSAFLRALDAAVDAAWQAQEAFVLAPGRPLPEAMGPLGEAAVQAELDDFDVESTLIAALGVGDKCLGHIVLGRVRDGAEWSGVELRAAWRVGRNLGHVVADARAEERERQLIAQLKSLADYRSRLLGTVSHELRTPLTSVIGYLEMLDDSPHLPADLRPLVDVAHRGGRRLSETIDNILAWQRLENGTSDPTAPVDVGRLAADAWAFYASTAERAEVALSWHPPPASGPGPVVEGHRGEIDRLLSNLLSNAIKYTPAGGRVDLRLDTTESAVVVTVSDTGIGIHPDELDRVFEEFYRVDDPVSSSVPGTGLGLAIVRHTAERHGGSVDVESEPGTGSRFTVRLPRR